MKNYMFLALVSFSLMGCGDAQMVDCIDGCSRIVGVNGKDGATGERGLPGPKGEPGIPGTSCYAASVSGGLNITCGSNLPLFLANGTDGNDGHDGMDGTPGQDGADGARGNDGTNGVDGRDGLDGNDGADGTNGTDGNDGQDGADGTNGSNGSNGRDGTNGIDGTGCVVTSLSPTSSIPTGGAQITCGASQAIVINGSSSGAASAYSVVGKIDPCGNSNQHDEVFLRLASGELVALFTDNASALTARLSYVKDGTSYRTTDAQQCYFSISTGPATVAGSIGQRTIVSTSPVVVTESWPVY